jgi:DNA-binding NarL/FixJ family response regulator
MALGLRTRVAQVAALAVPDDGTGLTHKEIGAQLCISPETVEHHVAKIRQKLGRRPGPRCWRPCAPSWRRDVPRSQVTVYVM